MSSKVDVCNTGSSYRSVLSLKHRLEREIWNLSYRVLNVVFHKLNCGMPRYKQIIMHTENHSLNTQLYNFDCYSHMSQLRDSIRIGIKRPYKFKSAICQYLVHQGNIVAIMMMIPQTMMRSHPMTPIKTVTIMLYTIKTSVPKQRGNIYIYIVYHIYSSIYLFIYFFKLSNVCSR